ncbi:SRPBCC family protein [Caulobacter sp. X]|uniref:SRPBCC family protein n=1 Tax=Caulobacter sp. X TaxID=2048901 RepID=UPI000C14831A|nr:SRPBCC family protein [Caulobacter sp. X]PIB96583.1 ATPase [Caulobacter sp. X]
MSGKNETVVTRKSDRELVVTRVFDGPVRLVFEAWSKPELFQRWWVPKALGVPLRACEMDVRTGGGYRLEFGLDAANSMAFFGKYTDVTPPSRIVWTNEEGGEVSVTTVTFEAQGDKTLLTLSELYPSKAACDEALQGSAQGFQVQFEQLDELLVELVA